MERLRQRLSQIQARLAEAEKLGLTPLNEADTERLVVEPVLEALGYGLLDYKRHAQGVGADFPDYTILPLSERKWCLEVKDWDARLKEGFERQAVNYANNNGAQWAVLTNGRVWWIYNTRAPGSLRDMRAYEVTDIFDAKAAADVLAHLSRESVEGGDLDREYRSREVQYAVLGFLRSGDRALLRTVQKGVAQQLDRNISLDDVEKALGFVLSIAPIVPTIQTPLLVEEIPIPVVKDGFTSLAELALHGEDLAGTKPAAGTLPDHTEVQILSWRALVHVVVGWLIAHEKLPTLPFSGTTRGKNYFMNGEPIHSNGKQMMNYTKFDTAQGPVYVDVNRSAANIVDRLVELCRSVGQSPDGFQVVMKTD